MQISPDEAIGIYARASRAWFKGKAAARTHERILDLAQAGDIEGVQVWKKVLHRIQELEISEPLSPPPH